MQCELTDIMLEAGRRMLAYANPAVHEKAGHANFVTEADVATQDYLMEALARRWPGARFYAEEEKEHRLTDGLTFIIDPIDGTTNYMRGRRASTISVGAVENGRAVFGAVLDPYHGELYHAVRGKGAYLGEARLHVSDVPFDNALICLGTSPYESDLAELTARCAAAVMRACADLRRTGSAALDLCDVAAGRCEGAFEWILQPWDYCAGSLLVEEAGGCTGCITGGETVFDHGIPFMSGSARCFEPLRRLLQNCQRA